MILIIRKIRENDQNNIFLTDLTRKIGGRRDGINVMIFISHITDYLYISFCLYFEEKPHQILAYRLHNTKNFETQILVPLQILIIQFAHVITTAHSPCSLHISSVKHYQLMLKFHHLSPRHSRSPPHPHRPPQP